MNCLIELFLKLTYPPFPNVEFKWHDQLIQMKRIRVIDLSYNRIRSLEPMFLMNVDGFLVNVDLSHNRLRTIDVTNIVWTKQSITHKNKRD
jgi:hypothetical protein